MEMRQSGPLFRFLSTLPAWGATIFAVRPYDAPIFLSTLPAWGATAHEFQYLSGVIFLSTLPAWGATEGDKPDASPDAISIHAPRVGSDAAHYGGVSSHSDFYPRSPRGERRAGYSLGLSIDKFLSTLPAWGATWWAILKDICDALFLSTLPAWGATRHWQTGHKRTRQFLSTLPAWGATLVHISALDGESISIHAPRVGSDQADWWSVGRNIMISIHAPRVGSDVLGDQTHGTNVISIHAPRVGSDRLPVRWTRAVDTFLSTLPAWGATSSC